MERIEFSKKEFKDRLARDPRVSDEYIDKVELPQAFSTGSKFLKKYILQKSGFETELNIPSDWFQFSQLIEKVEVEKDLLKIVYDEDKGSHPPLKART